MARLSDEGRVGACGVSLACLGHGFLRIINGFAKLHPFVTSLTSPMHKMPVNVVSAASEDVISDNWVEVGESEPEFKPLSREEARRWRAEQPNVSVWWLVKWQVLVGVGAGLLGGLLTQQLSVAWSVFYGAAAVALPSALMAYGITSSALSRLLAGVAQAAFAGFLLWEGVKILLAVAMLWLAPRIVPDLSWLALLAGLVLTLKVYWFGFFVRSRRSNVNG